MFAKLFGPDDRQILVMLDEGDAGPQISFYAQPPGLGVCSVVMQFPDNDAGWATAERAFAKVDEEAANRCAASLFGATSPYAPERG